MTTKTATKTKTKATKATPPVEKVTTNEAKELGLAFIKEIDNLMIKQAQGKITAGNVFIVLGDLTKQFEKLLQDS